MISTEIRQSRFPGEAVRLNEDWIKHARRELMETRCDSRSWGYQRGGAPCVEPTVLACLALRVSSGDEPSASDLAIGRSAAAWLSDLQEPDGSVPVSRGLGTPGWSTPYALLLWCSSARNPTERERARDCLLMDRGAPRTAADRSEKILGDDPTLNGWPWVEGTHSWIEPTAMAIIALCRQGEGGHPRVKEGIRLILDRALDRGGWNCGNKSVFGHELRPLPGPTGMALLALAAHGDRSPAISRAVDYLLGTLPRVRAPVSLGWGVMALRAHRAFPAEADAWLADAHQQSRERASSTMNPALLLLAAHAGEACFIDPPIAGEPSS